jgi:hypothetical protein
LREVVTVRSEIGLLLEDLAHIGQYRRRAQISSASYGS